MAGNDNAAPMLAGIGGGGVVWKAVAAPDYPTEPASSIEIATRMVSRRFGVSLPLAREVCRLARIGGAA
jgi:hypothetical protein